MGRTLCPSLGDQKGFGGPNTEFNCEANTETTQRKLRQGKRQTDIHVKGENWYNFRARGKDFIMQDDQGQKESSKKWH